ncbi:hypothetical protein D3C81_1765310 [compost metagenome]
MTDIGRSETTVRVIGLGPAIFEVRRSPIGADQLVARLRAVALDVPALTFGGDERGLGVIGLNDGAVDDLSVVERHW